jgi:hypothetical protein
MLAVLADAITSRFFGNAPVHVLSSSRPLAVALPKVTHCITELFFPAQPYADHTHRSQPLMAEKTKITAESPDRTRLRDIFNKGATVQKDGNKYMSFDDFLKVFSA